MNSPGSESVFLSYRRKDSEFAELLERELQQVGITAWHDTDEVHTGDY